MNLGTSYFTFFAIAGLVLAAPQYALAHAKLSSASPTQNATLKSGPKEIKLVFGESVESSLSTIELDDAQGQAIATSKGTKACTGKVCRLAIAPPPAGDYTVKYHVLSGDGHVVSGSYMFHVKG